jgi:hypothetical protein
MLINPWIFYLIGVCDAIGVICALILCMSFFAMILVGIFMLIDEKNIALKRAFKKIVIVFAISGLVGTFVPSESTATKMLIASQVNETNVEHAKEVIDYIVEKIQEVKE